MIGALFSLVVTAAMIVLVVVLIRRARTGHGGGSAASEGHAIRRFFQYFLLYGLLVVVGIGLSGLVGRLIHTDVLVAGDDARLARDLAFSVVGLPLLLLVAFWSRRRFAADPSETWSLGWAFYISAASLTSLVTAMTALSQTLQWAVGLSDFSGAALAQVIVWGSIWGVHWWLDGRVTPAPNARLHHLGGSLIGLGTAATGLVILLGGALRTLLGLDVGQVLAQGGNPLRQGLVVLVVGAPVWFVYWVRTASRQQRDPLWFAYVLLAGVGAGLVAAVTAASLLLYSVLVWFVGDVRAPSAALHFQSSPTQAATVVVGLLVWWYHQAVLKQAGAHTRTEVHRVYEYLMSAIGLFAAAAGLTTAVVALIEAVAGTDRVIVGTSTVNTLLAAVTLLVVGSPVWWLYWRRIELVAASEPTELLSTTRRVYLFVLFGVGGVVAVISLIVGVYLLFEDLVAGRVGGETLRRMRFAVGVLLATAAISGYHFAVYRRDRDRAPAAEVGRGPRHVLLIGPDDPELTREVARRTHARVQAWARTDPPAATLATTPATTWSADAVVAALEQVVAEDVVVLSGAGGLEVIPVRRG